jgi:4-hydroxybenzoate polyprenyltransferase
MGAPGGGRLASDAAEAADVETIVDEDPPKLASYLAALRPHQWLKNALVFLPLLATRRIYELDLLWQGLLVFAAFSLCASSAYILNDLLDLPSDRRHPRKRNRPFASGQVALLHGLALATLLLLVGFVLGALLSPLLFGVLALYYALTLSYSLRLKDIVILDVLALAGLYTLRVMAGAAAFDIPPSAWLLAFCVFLFFSLAMIKRYAELMAMRAVEGSQAHARAYLLEDSELLAALGGASGYLSVLVLALYITSDAMHDPHARYQLIWLTCVLLLYWISYMWTPIRCLPRRSCRQTEARDHHERQDRPEYHAGHGASPRPRCDCGSSQQTACLDASAMLRGHRMRHVGAGISSAWHVQTSPVANRS